MPKGKKLYIEVWDEPDLGYWKDTQEDFLELYKQTALAVKEASVDVAVGGAAVNGYSGKFSKEKDPYQC